MIAQRGVVDIGNDLAAVAGRVGRAGRARAAVLRQVALAARLRIVLTVLYAGDQALRPAAFGTRAVVVEHHGAEVDAAGELLDQSGRGGRQSDAGAQRAGDASQVGHSGIQDEAGEVGVGPGHGCAGRGVGQRRGGHVVAEVGHLALGAVVIELWRGVTLSQITGAEGIIAIDGDGVVHAAAADLLTGFGQDFDRIIVVELIPFLAIMKQQGVNAHRGPRGPLGQVGITVAHDLGVHRPFAGDAGIQGVGQVAQATERRSLECRQARGVLPGLDCGEAGELVVAAGVDLNPGLSPAAGPVQVVVLGGDRSAHREGNRGIAHHLDEPLALAAARLGQQHAVCAVVVPSGQGLFLQIQLAHAEPIQETAARHQAVHLAGSRVDAEIAFLGCAAGSCRHGLAGGRFEPGTGEIVLVEFRRIEVSRVAGDRLLEGVGAVVQAVVRGIRVAQVVHAGRIVHHEQEVRLESEVGRGAAVVSHAGQVSPGALRAKHQEQIHDAYEGEEGPTRA